MDTRTQAERDYDALKDGSAYAKPAEEHSPLLTDLIAWTNKQLDAGQDAPDPAPNLSPDFKARVDARLAEEHTALAREADRLIAQEEDIWEPILDILDDPTNDGRPRIVRSRDEAHRQELWNAILEQVAEMDETDQAEMFGYMMGVLDGMRVGKGK
jgi:hypothetical protein